MFDWLRRKRPPRHRSVPVAEPEPAAPIPVAPPVVDDTDRLPDIGAGPFMIRPLEDSDLPWLPRIFRAAIKGQGADFYTSAQCDAWAATAEDEAQFVARLGEGVTIVAELDGKPGAFAQLYPHDTIEMLYVAPGLGGYGIATLLCQYLEDEARIAGTATLHTAASLVAKKFFESMGFRSEGEESVERHGVALSRHKMVKALR